MDVRRVTAALAVAMLFTVSCGSDGETTAESTTTVAATSSTTPASSTTAATTTVPVTSTSAATTTTEAPADPCATAAVLGVVDAAIDRAHLSTAAEWSTDTEASPFAERTATGELYAERLALDCGLTATRTVDGSDYLVVAAWTGPRMGFVVQTDDTPAEPFRQDATVTVSIDATKGEYLDGEDRALWAGTFDNGETFIVGHVDYVLGPVAKDWIGEDRPPQDDFVTLDSERHAIAALAEADMRNIGIAEPPQLGSEEGLVQFVTPAGQIMVVDVAPTDWFDPMQPRYFSGSTTFETIAGVEVRITEPNEGDNLGFNLGNEFAWACDNFVWIVEPPFNGTADEMRLAVAAIVSTQECTAG